MNLQGAKFFQATKFFNMLKIYNIKYAIKEVLDLDSLPLVRRLDTVFFTAQPILNVTDIDMYEHRIH